MDKIILASASPRRRDILMQAGIPFTVCPADVDENIAAESPFELVQALSAKKSLHVASQLTGRAVVIGADTVVAIHNQILGKPRDEEDAARMLTMLQGQKHSVYTGVCVTVVEGGRLRDMRKFVDNTSVYMRRLGDEEIQAYIRTREPFDKAGAYAIQGKGMLLVEKIEGDYQTVVGLPVIRLYEALKSLNIQPLLDW